jgi:hypothetical protein
MLTANESLQSLQDRFTLYFWGNARFRAATKRSFRAIAGEDDPQDYADDFVQDAYVHVVSLSRSIGPSGPVGLQIALQGTPDAFYATFGYVLASATRYARRRYNAWQKTAKRLSKADYHRLRDLRDHDHKTGRVDGTPETLDEADAKVEDHVYVESQLLPDLQADCPDLAEYAQAIADVGPKTVPAFLREFFGLTKREADNAARRLLEYVQDYPGKTFGDMETGGYVGHDVNGMKLTVRNLKKRQAPNE